MVQGIEDGLPAAESVESESRQGLFSDTEAMTRLIYLVVGAASIALVFWKLQFSTGSICCGDFDGYYHMKWSRLLWEGMCAGHFPPVFKWLPLTTLNPKDYVDHHLLFHFALIPFTWFSDLRLGAKIATTIFASLAVLSCYWLVIRYRLSYPLMWLLALLTCAHPFLFRMNMTKAPPLTIIFVAAGIYLLFEKRYIWLLPLAFVFALTYDMVVLLGIAAVIWAAIIGWTERRFEWRPVLWVALGTIAGFVINPYFPHNVGLLYEHVMMKITAADFSTKVGGEWYPYDSWEFLRWCPIAFLSMLAGYIAFDWRDKAAAAKPLFFLVFSTLLLVLNARYKRFVEYWPPFAVLFAAFSLQLRFAGLRGVVGLLPAEMLNELEPFLDRVRNAPRRLDPRELWQTGAAVIVTVALGGALFLSVRLAARDVADSAVPSYYKAGMDWVRNNVPPGEMIFNSDWDDFPRLFFFDDTHVYVSGLDPTYLLDKHPDLSELFDRITTGQEADPAPLIRDRFGARYIFTDNAKEHDKLVNNALDSGWCDTVFEDDDCTVLHIRDQKGEPPKDEPDDAHDNQDNNGSDDGDEPDDDDNG